MRHPIRAFNERVAILGTTVFSSMWAFYVFFIWGLLTIIPWVPGGFKQFALLVSSAWIQLFCLPLIAVGAAVMNRAAERRSIQDHETLKKEFAAQNDEMKRLAEIDSKLDKILARLDSK